MALGNRMLDPFERWGPIAFVLGGVGILATTVFGSLLVLDVFPSPPWLQMGPMIFGLWFVFVGLVGFGQHVAESAPRLSRGGTWTAAVAWVLWTLTIAAALAVDLTSERTFIDPGSWAPPLLALGFVLALFSFLLFGVASVRTEQPSRELGLLLLVPVIAFFGQAVLLLSKIVTGEVVGALQLALGGVIGLALIWVGHRLRTADGSTRPAPTHAETTH